MSPQPPRASAEPLQSASWVSQTLRCLAAVAAALALWAVSLLAWALAPSAIQKLAIASWRLDLLLLLALILLGVVVLAILVTALMPPVLAWWGSRHARHLDLISLSLLLLLASSLATPSSHLKTFGVGLELGVLLVLIIGRIICWRHSVNRRRRQPVAGDPPLLDRVLGKEGLAPLDDFQKDELKRHELLNALVGLVRHPRQKPITFGVEGPWGSGKTTILKALHAELMKSANPVATFDAWSYREPSQLISGYLKELGRTLAVHGVVPHPGRFERQIARGLLEFSGGRIARAFSVLSGDLFRDSAARSKLELRTALSNLDQPVVVLVDDLDRLGEGELVAVLRLIRLVSDLPNVAHVVAYDRRQLAQTLFPNDPEGTRARDYLAKVIELELPLGSTPKELIGPLLDSAMNPLLGTISESARESFLEDIHEAGLSTIMAALLTPREVRRVAAATAWYWERMSQHLNLFDLFIVSILHYRAPDVYDTLRSRPEWFANTEWSEDPRRILHEDDWREQGQAWLRTRRESTDSRDATVGRLVAQLFPHLDIGEHLQGPSLARKERRIAHPAIYNRYFLPYVPSDAVSEAQIEEFAETLEGMEPGAERQDYVVRVLREEMAAGRIESFLDQWNLVFPASGDAREQLSDELVEDLSLALAEVSAELPKGESFFTISPRRMAVFRIHLLSLGLDSGEAITQLLLRVIDRSQDLRFCGDILTFSNPRTRSAEHRDAPIAAVDTLEEALVNKILGRVRANGKLLTDDLNFTRDALGSALFDIQPNEEIKEAIIRDLAEKSMLLPYLLSVVTPIEVSPERGRIRTEHADLGRLAEKMSLEQIDEITGGLQLDSWPEGWQRDLVEQFRMHLETTQPDPEGDETS